MNFPTDFKVRNIWLVAVVPLLLFAVLWATARQTEAVAGQVAYWSLDETSGTTFSNVAGSGTLDATCTNCPTPAGGVVAGGQAFDGASQMLTVAAAAALDVTAVDSFAVEAWVQPDAGGCASDGVVVGRGNGLTGPFWSLGCAAGTGQAQFRLSDGTHTVTVTSTRVISPGTWHHLVGVWDGGSDTAVLYLDYTDVVTATGVALAGDLAPTTANLTIGSMPGAAYFAGTVDEVALTTGVLPANEIGTHYYLPRAYATTCDTLITVMPLGDSITRGDFGSQFIDPDTGIQTGDLRPPELVPGYRQPLYLNLRNASHDVDFVGAQQDGAAVVPQFDFEHAGIDGQTDAQVASSVYQLLTTNPADVVLLHIGTNGINASAADVEQILNEVDRYETDNGRSVTVVLALIINRVPTDATFTSFNANVQAMALARIVAGDKIVLVDMESNAHMIYSLYGAGGDFADRLHPYTSGYAKMADSWLGVLETFLPSCHVPPLVASLPLTATQTYAPYHYQVTASGSPTITYHLDSPAAGMAIDGDLISWTPTVAGSYPVTVTAVNPYGSDVQTFTVQVTSTVPTVPPTITSAPVDHATLDVAYRYDVKTSGDQPITYTLTTAPAGMVIDAVSGVISWLPTTTGVVDVTVLAANAVASDSQTFAVTVAQSAPLVCSLPPNLVAYYPLDDTGGTVLADIAGNSNDLTCTSGNCAAPDVGQINGGQVFTATDTITTDAANPTNFNFADSDSFSLSLWVNTTQDCTAENKVFVARRYAQFWLGCVNGGGLEFKLTSDNNVTQSVVGGAGLNDGAWHHVAGVVEDGAVDVIRVYLDGVEVGSSSAVFDAFTTATEPLTVGYYNVTPYYFFEGRLDDVAIFRRGLSAAEVAAIYNTGQLGIGLTYDTVWVGGSGDWATPGNWSGGVPDAQGRVYVPTGTAQMSGSTAVECLVVDKGAAVDLSTFGLTVADVVVNNGTLRQTVANVDGPQSFLHLTDSGGSVTKYRGVDLTPAGNLGSVAVSVREIDSGSGEVCTSGGTAVPVYADRCYTITPTNPGAATVRLYARQADELNGLLLSELAVFREAGAGDWQELVFGHWMGATADGYVYAQGETSTFSAFLLGQGRPYVFVYLPLIVR